MKGTGEDFSCIAVDMGAGSVRVMLARIRGGILSLDEIHRFRNEIRVQDGRDTWDIDLIIKEIISGILMAMERSDLPPQSVGVDAWGVDFVLLDRNGDLVDTPVAYRDRRTEGMQEKWGKLMPEFETFTRTGINFYIFNSLFQLLSLKDSKVLQRSSRILFIPSYLNYLLSGKAANELTISSTSQLLALDGTWDKNILERLNLDKSKLGELVQGGTVLGPVLRKELGQNRIQCVAVCGHDTACVVAAIPVENPNYAFISAGTWCIVGIESPHPLISREALQLGITNERAYGSSYRPLKNIVGLWLLQGLRKHFSAGISYAQMEEMVETEDRVNQVIDPDDPGFYNPDSMKEAFDTYFEKTGQPRPEKLSDYIRCAYDSLCFSFRYHIEQLEILAQKPIQVLHLVGGGSQSDYLCQRIASICKREVISGPVEGAAMGNALIQAIAMGRIENLQEGRKLVIRSCKVKKYRPAATAQGTEERYKKYLTLKI